MIKYVVGFLFSPDKKFVVMIKKDHPEWQAGKLNGVGGKLKPIDRDSAQQAMTREFYEEAGLFIENWKEVCTLKHEGVYELTVFKASHLDYHKATTMETEMVLVCRTKNLPERYDVIPNAKWLIPLCFDNTIQPFEVLGIGGN